MLIVLVYFYIKLLPGMAFEALCVNKHDLSRGDDRERERRLRWDLVSGRQTSDDNKE